MSQSPVEVSELFDETLDLPNGRAAERHADLVGLESASLQLRKELMLVVQRDALEEWSRERHGGVLPAIANLARRSPLVILAGEVGCGKTSLAETFADALARERTMRVHVLRMSLRVRGHGAVGQMTSLIAAAFDEVVHIAQPFRAQVPARGAVVLIVDEADAVAQSRDLRDMHHEDRAGVNALIRGITHLAERQLPAMVVLCTNRIDAVDPALRRRAAVELRFERPSTDQRAAVLAADLHGAGFSTAQLRELAELTGPTNGRAQGFTYSDLRERLIPTAILRAYPHEALNFDDLARLAAEMAPTPSFESDRK
jgi:AAA+ superfamily predicted ATPase